MSAMPDVRSRLWQRMLELDARGVPFTIADLVRVGVSKGYARLYVQALLEGDYVEETKSPPPPPGERARKHYRLRRRLPTAPFSSRITQQHLMWNTMRRLCEFNAQELAAVASTEAISVSLVNAQRYIRLLHLAGYLRRVRPPSHGRRALWRLIRNTGPRAPRQFRGGLYDPNTRQFQPLEGNP